MSSLSPESLYQLLPEIYRRRDEEQGFPLKALMEILAEQAGIVKHDIDRLYDNQFIETCDEWAAPYLGELVGYRHGPEIPGVSQRAAAANQIRLTRKRGVALALEQLATDTTRWPARVVEFFQLLARPEHLAAIRPENHYTLDVRDSTKCDAIGSAFDSASYSMATGRISQGEGRHHFRHVGIFLWRLGQYRQSILPAYRFAARRYLFNPLGCNTPLFNQPIPEPNINHLANEENLPVALKRNAIAGDRLSVFYPHAFTLVIDGILLTDDQIQICNLSDAGADWAHSPVSLVSVDPELGRISLPASLPEPESLEVTYHYGACADIGGGAYSRSEGFIVSHVAVQSIGDGDSIQVALDLLVTGGIAEIGVSHRFAESPNVAVDTDQTLSLRAADGHRAFIDLEGDEMILEGGPESEIVLDGLVITNGRVIVPDNGDNTLRRLVLRNVTMVPGLSLDIHGEPVSPNSPSLVVEIPNVTVEIEQSILGSIRTVEGASVTVKDSIIDATSKTGTAFSSLDGMSHGGMLTLCESTVIGKVAARSFPLISNSILDASLDDADAWTAPVWALQRQTGCARFSYIPPESRVPRQHRCQPQFAVSKAIEAAQLRNPSLTELAESHIARGVRARVVPAFTSTRYNAPAYGQLLLSAPEELRRGADSGSEMGVYHHLYHPQRHDALLFRLNEFLPIGLDAGLIYVT
ncbi:hypothetical protein LRP49_04620 [Enterovibrio sp. ZSDZ35]|uniref:Phage tail protein (Tail_P2_I) n=1 Tax=Enterovibrio qingdaonensis TaxID=2899818 RepID=A0ABT5QIM9_9GAMM|nr:hypothetical protein [Enterovibrio sp. ZSDZ35]MDD1780479.1 hypothetical protein [Enterovibrio sp. ZSDZ35]